VPRREGYYDLTTHLPWIGERTRKLGGAHMEYFRGIQNPIGIKLGSGAAPSDVLALCGALNPRNEAGKIIFITRLGQGRAKQVLPPLIDAARKAEVRVLWVCDPMHGNGIKTASGIKTRSFDAIAGELEETFDVHQSCGTHLGGVHFELTGDDVTECVGGAAGITEHHLTRNYATLCDPRLNYQQALELAFIVARRLTPRK